MRKPDMVIVGAVLAVVGLLAVLQLTSPPNGYRVKIKHSTGSYYTKDWRFDESHNCVVFEDHKQTRRVLCGDYSMENVK